jgi:hypothetical protein
MTKVHNVHVWKCHDETPYLVQRINMFKMMHNTLRVVETFLRLSFCFWNLKNSQCITSLLIYFLFFKIQDAIYFFSSNFVVFSCLPCSTLIFCYSTVFWVNMDLLGLCRNLSII